MKDQPAPLPNQLSPTTGRASRPTEDKARLIRRAAGGEPELQATLEGDYRKAYSDAARTTLRKLAREAARSVIFQFPAVPDAPDPNTMSPEEYVRQRLANIAPALLERRVVQARTGGPGARASAEQELLDRAGYGRHTADTARSSAPPVVISIVNNPYLQQGKTVEAAATAAAATRTEEAEFKK